MEHDLAVQNRLAQKYLLGELDAGERDEFEAHIAEKRCTVRG